MQKIINKELRNMNEDSLKNHAEEIRKKIFLIKMKKKSTPEKNIVLVRSLRKSLARTLTFLRQREMHASK